MTPSLGVLLGSIGGAIALLVLICVLVLRRMRHRRGNVRGEHHESLALGHRRQFSSLDLETATGNFSEENVIGVGSFAKVYKGILPGPDNKAVAVKRLLKILNDGAFRREAELISAAVHRNVLSLIGYCVTETEQLLVYPFMESLSLSSRLKRLKQNELALDWPIRMQIAVDVARGLEYLHDICISWIIHRDIKSANVLLDENLEAVIGDFGLAKLMEAKEEVTKVRGTHGYIAPEYLQTSKA
uniref:non-specific serine/threonine protein kinase n=1 Tax=Hordeum vulgare subsp. vulgare TaxID=112509 RepID=A0A8I6WP18_HORVV